jgi:hypothetical protein
LSTATCFNHFQYPPMLWPDCPNDGFSTYVKLVRRAEKQDIFNFWSDLVGHIWLCSDYGGITCAATERIKWVYPIQFDIKFVTRSLISLREVVMERLLTRNWLSTTFKIEVTRGNGVILVQITTPVSSLWIIQLAAALLMSEWKKLWERSIFSVFDSNIFFLNKVEGVGGLDCASIEWSVELHDMYKLYFHIVSYSGYILFHSIQQPKLLLGSY